MDERCAGITSRICCPEATHVKKTQDAAGLASLRIVPRREPVRATCFWVDLTRGKLLQVISARLHIHRLRLSVRISRLTSSPRAKSRKIFMQSSWQASEKRQRSSSSSASTPGSGCEVLPFWNVPTLKHLSSCQGCLAALRRDPSHSLKSPLYSESDVRRLILI